MRSNKVLIIESKTFKEIMYNLVLFKKHYLSTELIIMIFKIEIIKTVVLFKKLIKRRIKKHFLVYERINFEIIKKA